MAVNINLNLKTLNGQSLHGSGNMTINSINWKGSFSTAPLSPSQYDAYHNTTDGNSYIYNGSSWTILAAKGTDGNSGSSGMFFPHDTLTNEDVGKLVIWKDGKCQLPVFSGGSEASNWKYSYELNLDSMISHHYDEIIISFTSQPVDGDKLKITASKEITFRNSPSDLNDCQIGALLEDTIELLQGKIQYYGYEDATIEGEDLILRRKELGIYGYWSFNGDYFENCEITGSYATITNNFISIQGRIGSTLVPFLFVRAIGFTETIKSSQFYEFYSSEAFSEICTNAHQIHRIPTSLSEIKDGIVEYLLLQEGILTAEWENQNLLIESTIELNTELLIDEGDEDFWNNAFDEGIIVTPASPSTPVKCNYPIIGLVKSVTENQVEIHSEPICTFKSSFDETVSWSLLNDPLRCWVLDPNNPGYLLPLFTNEIEGFDDIVNFAFPGYVWALDNEIESNSTFTGAFSLDLFPLQLLYLIFSSEGGD